MKGTRTSPQWCGIPATARVVERLLMGKRTARFHGASFRFLGGRQVVARALLGSNFAERRPVAGRFVATPLRPQFTPSFPASNFRGHHHLPSSTSTTWRSTAQTSVPVVAHPSM